jgi:hypothetical protein
VSVICPPGGTCFCVARPDGFDPPRTMPND